MFPREKGSPTTKKTSIQLCESYRNEDGKPRNRVLITLGPTEKLRDSGELLRLGQKLLDLANNKSS